MCIGRQSTAHEWVTVNGSERDGGWFDRGAGIRGVDHHRIRDAIARRADGEAKSLHTTVRVPRHIFARVHAYVANRCIARVRRTSDRELVAASLSAKLPRGDQETLLCAYGALLVVSVI